MKIIYLHQYFNTLESAGGTRSYQVASRLVRMEHEVDMVTTDHQNHSRDGVLWRDSIEQGIKVHWLKSAYSNKMGFLKRIAAFLKYAVHSTFKVCSLEGDVILATSTPLTVAIPAIIASKIKKIPMIFEVRDVWPAAPIELGILRNPFLIWIANWMEKAAYRNASLIVALSPGMKDGVLKKVKCPEKVIVIPNMSDTQSFSPLQDGLALRSRLGIQDKFVCLYLGTFGFANHLDYVLNAAKTVQESGDKKVVFLLVGDGKEKAGLQSRSASMGLKNVIFLDPISKKSVPEMLAACDLSMNIFLNKPILHTCSPNKLFDSLAAGKPVLTNTFGWLRELVEKNECGIAVEPDDAADFAAKLQRLKNDTKKLRTMGINARKVAENQFACDRLVAQYEKMIRETARSQG